MMDKRGFTEKDLLKWITIIAAVALVYIILKAILQGFGIKVS